MVYHFTKRILDIVLTLILLIIFSPVCLIAAILIKLEDGGSILADVPERVGKNGKPFKIYKFRSMITDAHRILRTDPKLKKLYAEYKKGSYKLKNDPRVTSIGRFIRKHSIDEIPQLFNVIKGDMSLVGPRPYYPDELKEQQQKYPHTKKLVRVVLNGKPGVTGFWQVSGRSEVNFDKRIKMDADYVKGKSIWQDILILVKTPWTMLSGKGAM